MDWKILISENKAYFNLLYLKAEVVVVDVLPVPPPLKLGGPGGPAGGPPAPLVKLKPGGGIGLWLAEV